MLGTDEHVSSGTCEDVNIFMARTTKQVRTYDGEVHGYAIISMGTYEPCATINCNNEYDDECGYE